jgi:hypothetical protein
VPFLPDIVSSPEPEPSVKHQSHEDPIASRPVVVLDESDVAEPESFEEVARGAVVWPHYEVNTTGSGGLGIPYGGVQESSAAALSLEFGSDAERHKVGVVLTRNMHRQRISSQRAVAPQQKEIATMAIEELPEKQVVVTLTLPERFMIESVQVGKIFSPRGPGTDPARR